MYDTVTIVVLSIVLSSGFGLAATQFIHLRDLIGKLDVKCAALEERIKCIERRKLKTDDS